MSVFGPEDFAGKPYLHALNQMGHFVLGGAAAVASTGLVLIVIAGVFALREVIQWGRGATVRDALLDTAFFGAGVWFASTGFYGALAAFVAGYVLTAKD